MAASVINSARLKPPSLESENMYIECLLLRKLKKFYLYQRKYF